ncbi:MAG: transglutaminase family protein [Candidatus Rokubacteria bacterium]|nr:transglutaminase family protein [Candidatus Rokubacteria bacterium]
MTLQLDACLAPGEFVDSDDPDVRAFAQAVTAGAGDPISRAIALYGAVRDRILYDPYHVGEAPAFFRASDCLRAGRGFCVPKAALLAAAGRAVGIPTRVGYADVRNHLSTPKLLALVGGDLFVWHGFTELHLDGRWVKATPAFNLGLCERFGVRPLEFDGRHDSLFHEHDRAGRRHMEYVRERGSYPDVPYATILAGFRQIHPRWLAHRAAGGPGDFAREAAPAG